MPDYSKMTTEDFNRILRARMSEMSPSDILSVPGVYEIFAEHFNNEVLADWASEREMEREELFSRFETCPSCGHPWGAHFGMIDKDTEEFVTPYPHNCTECVTCEHSTKLDKGEVQ